MRHGHAHLPGDPECEHGFSTRRLANGSPACPVCRLTWTPPPKQHQPVRTIRPARQDSAALAANDDTLWKD